MAVAVVYLFCRIPTSDALRPTFSTTPGLPKTSFQEPRSATTWAPSASRVRAASASRPRESGGHGGSTRGFGKYIELQFAKPAALGDDVPNPRMTGARRLSWWWSGERGDGDGMTVDEDRGMD